MIKIRQDTFETNSSSTHSIVICTKETFIKWKAGTIKFNPYKEEFVKGVSPDAEAEIRKNAPIKYAEEHNKNSFYRTWEELGEEAREQYIQMLLVRAVPKDVDLYSYDGYVNYFREGLEYTEKYFKTEHGDEVVAFGKGGYD